MPKNVKLPATSTTHLDNPLFLTRPAAGLGRSALGTAVRQFTLRVNEVRRPTQTIVISSQNKIHLSFQPLSSHEIATLTIRARTPTDESQSRDSASFSPVKQPEPASPGRKPYQRQPDHGSPSQRAIYDPIRRPLC